ncbi:MAG: MATE family efflux transporter [Clostridia bacterium]|nr:MATE family efflux transporter [Clostridia bacterium]MBN2881917.1 MATE family efflux transporter [Clostridia bacterium]
MDEKKRDMILNGKLGTIIIKLAFPIMLNNLIQTVYNITDTYFVSQLGDTEVAATGFVWNLIFLVISIGMGLSVAGRSMISQYVGAHDEESARHTEAQLFSFLSLLGMAVSIIFYIIAPFIIKLMGAEGDLYTYSLVYMRIIMLGMPFSYLYFAFSSAKNARGDMVTPMIIGAVSVVINVALDPVCIFDWGFGWGVAGAAIATTFARSIIAIAVIIGVSMGKFGMKLSISDLRFDKIIIGKILKLGIPASVGQATAAIGFTIMMVMVKSFGELTLAAYVIGSRVNSVVLMPLMGIGWGLTTIAGQNLGAGNINRVKSAFKWSIGYSMIFAVVGGVIMALTTEGIMEIFSDNPIVIEQGTFFLYMIILALPLMGIFQSMIGLYQGTGHTKFSSIMMIGRLWILRIPMIVIMKNFTDFGERSVWYAIILSNIVICTVGLIGYLQGFWKKKTV